MLWGSAALGVLVTIAVGLFGVIPLRTHSSIVLHYSTSYGIDRVGPWYAGFVPVALSAVTLAVNFFLTRMIAARHRLLSSIMGAFTAALAAGFAAATVIIVALNR